MAESYIASANFQKSPDSIDGAVGVGVITSVSLTEPAMDAPGTVHFDISYSDGYMPHSTLWRAAKADPIKPVVEKVHYDGAQFGVGGSYEWDPKMGENGLLKVFLYLPPEQRGEIDPDVRERFHAILGMSIGRILLDRLASREEKNGENVAYLYNAASGHTKPDITKPRNIVHHTERTGHLVRVELVAEGSGTPVA